MNGGREAIYLLRAKRRRGEGLLVISRPEKGRRRRSRSKKLQQSRNIRSPKQKQFDQRGMVLQNSKKTPQSHRATKNQQTHLHKFPPLIPTTGWQLSKPHFKDFLRFSRSPHHNPPPTTLQIHHNIKQRLIRTPLPLSRSFPTNTPRKFPFILKNL